MVVVERKRYMAQFETMFPDLAGAEKGLRCCGAVGYITENIAIVLGSILGCTTFF